MANVPGVLVMVLATVHLTWAFGISNRHIKQPLPLVTGVRYNTQQSDGSTQITVWYLCKDRPHMTWFVDGIPIARDNMAFQMNHFEYLGFAILQTSRDKGRRFSLCLTASSGRVCVQLRPLPDDQEGEEEVDFPWALIVPAPIARYYEGQKSRMFLPEMPTNHSYEYSASFIARDPQGNLVQGATEDMEGGSAGDLVTIKPATFGEGGWMVYANTDRHSYEGVLIIDLTYRPQGGLVESCTLSRPMEIYVRGHAGPFEPSFVAMVPQENSASTRNCRDGLDCIITCPFVANGEVTAVLNSVSRALGGNTKTVIGDVYKMGQYYGQASFLLTNFNRIQDSGTYMCSVSSDTMTVTSTVVIV